MNTNIVWISSDSACRQKLKDIKRGFREEFYAYDDEAKVEDIVKIIELEAEYNKKKKNRLRLA